MFLTFCCGWNSSTVFLFLCRPLLFDQNNAIFRWLVGNHQWMRIKHNQSAWVILTLNYATSWVLKISKSKTASITGCTQDLYNDSLVASGWGESSEDPERRRWIWRNVGLPNAFFGIWTGMSQSSPKSSMPPRIPLSSSEWNSSDPQWKAQGLKIDRAEWRFHQKPGRRENYVPGESWRKTWKISSNPNMVSCMLVMQLLSTSYHIKKKSKCFQIFPTKSQLHQNFKHCPCPRHIGWGLPWALVPSPLLRFPWPRGWCGRMHGMCWVRCQFFQWTHHKIHLYPIDAEIRDGSRRKMAEGPCTTCRIC